KNRESYYHSLVYLIIKMIGIYIDAEVSTSEGRIDAVIKTDDYLYVMEFKMLPDTPEDAVNQIKEKGYARPYAGDSRTKFMVGISFDAETKRFEDFVTEEF
ncbi:MAG: PD-(D/E)XK nuclease domain-containing protein, partial [bacterium]